MPWPAPAWHSCDPPRASRATAVWTALGADASLLARDDPADTVTWTAPASGNTLDWGTLYHFKFIANVAPAAAPVTLIGAATSTAAEPPYPRALLGPAFPNHAVSAD